MRLFTDPARAVPLTIAMLLLMAMLFCGLPGRTQDLNPVDLPGLDSCDVSWNVPGPTSSQSMPIGNGDIGLNVWAEPNGDLDFYIGKTDAWGGDARPDRDPWKKQGGELMKLGLVRVSLSPNPLPPGSLFRQTLRLRRGEILIREGDSTDNVRLRIWVDANHPVIRVEAESRRPVSVKVSLDDWRLHGGGDTVISSQANRIAWYHRNTPDSDPHVANLGFGAIIKGKGLVREDDTTIRSKGVTRYQLVSIYPLTATTPAMGDWEAKLKQQITGIDKLKLERTRLAHQQWWDEFWHRSWIFVHGDPTAAQVTQGYVLQRFITACAGRGAYPIKFNGSIFVVDHPALQQDRKPPVKVNADHRSWGGQYWFQNTRPMYWPRLMAGDFDEMMPLFTMYARMLPDNAAQVKNYYHHGGAYFAETSPFWGGLRYWGPEVKEDWTGHYFTPILELSMMMLDYYEYTGDEKFARELLLPVAGAGLRFFDQHFARDAAGKLLLDPDNSIEMFWKVHDPAPDIAGLHAILARMLALPDELTDTSTRAAWKRLQRELPELPTGTKDDKTVLLPYTGEQGAKPRNLENPELYAIYPFRLYGLGKPGLDLAINTFNTRKFKDKGCWVQDPIQAAMLGLADVAKTYVAYNLTRKDPDLKFPAFWIEGHDYMPDEDNGGNGENGLQEMLMQTDGKKILLLPAWPKEWDAEFKLHAPYNTIVEGKVVQGKLVELEVIPASRKADIIDWSDHP